MRAVTYEDGEVYKGSNPYKGDEYMWRFLDPMAYNKLLVALFRHVKAGGRGKCNVQYINKVTHTVSTIL